MHAQLLRRLPAERARHRNMKRLSQNQAGFDGDDDFTLTGPITITRVVVLSSSTPSSQPVITSSLQPLSSSSSSTTSSTSTSSSSTPTSSSISTIASPTSLPPAVAATSASTPTPSLVKNPQPSASAEVMSDSGNASQSNTALGSRKLPVGSIIGIVIAVLFFLLAVLFYFLRQRFMRNRQKRSASWKTGLFSKGIGRPKPSDFNMVSEKPSSGPGFVSPGVEFAKEQAQAMVVRVPVPAPPQTSYNNPAVSIPTALTPGGGSFSRVPVPDVAPPVNGATVKCTFIPTLPDELSISTGEVVRVLAEYDDGWALCVNRRGEQGMVPLECLDQGFTSQTYEGNDSRNVRRASSLLARR